MTLKVTERELRLETQLVEARSFIQLQAHGVLLLLKDHSKKNHLRFGASVPATLRTGTNVALVPVQTVRTLASFSPGSGDHELGLKGAQSWEQRENL